jgi:hypothetical protein
MSKGMGEVWDWSHDAMVELLARTRQLLRHARVCLLSSVSPAAAVRERISCGTGIKVAIYLSSLAQGMATAAAAAALAHVRLYDRRVAT